MYAAFDLELGLEVALKVVRGLDGTHRARFEREAALHLQLRHPDIVRAHRWGVLEDMGWIAFDRLHGQDLSHLVHEPSLTFVERLETLARIARALDYGHANKVIHRDVKPHNIFMRDGEGACLLDFGVAKLPDKPLTVKGRLVGTPAYMAPEYILETPVDHRADVFGLGVVAFQLLTGRRPWWAPEPHTLLIRICSIPPFRFEDLVGRGPVHVPQSLVLPLSRVIHTAIAHDPEDRFASARALAVAFEQAAAGSLTETFEVKRPRSGSHDRMKWARARAARLQLEARARRQESEEPKAEEASVEDMEARSSRVFWIVLFLVSGALVMALAVALFADLLP